MPSRCTSVAIAVAIALGTSTRAASQNFSVYKNSQYGFAFEFPSHWITETKPIGGSGTALIFSGPEGGDEFYTTINLQVLVPRPGDSLQKRIADLQQQFSTAKRYRLIEREDGRLGGYPATRLLVEYEIKGGKELYRQDQLVAAKDDYFYLIGYTAPADLFPRYRPFMERAIATFEFMPQRLRDTEKKD